MLKKRIRRSLLWVVPISTMLLIGCWDYEDIDKKSLVISVGVDRVGDKVEFSTEVAKLTSEGEGTAEQVAIKGVYRDVSYGKTFEEARVSYDSKRPYPTFLGATRVVVFSEKYAREGIESYLNRINHIFDYRKTLPAVVSRDPPRKLFDFGVENDISVGFFIEHNLRFLERTGAVLYPRIGELLSNIAMGEIGYVLPYIGIDEGAVRYLGLAVMKDSKLIEIIDVKDTKGILYILTHQFQSTQAIPSPKENGNLYSVKKTLEKRRIKTDYADGRPIIRIQLDLKAELQYQYHMEPISYEEIKKLEQEISQQVKKDILEIIERTQKEFECDIFRFGMYFRADHPDIYKQIKWKEEYPKADIRVIVKTKIANQHLSDPNAEKKY